MGTLKSGDAAAGFSLKGIEGRGYSLEEPSGGVTFLAFFKNNCPTCILTLPFLQRLSERLEGAPARFLGISQDDVEPTRAFAEEHGITFPLLPDASGYPVSNAYGITSVPTLYLIEPEGRISWTSLGFVKSDLENLAAILRARFRIPGVTPLFVEADGVPALRPG